MKSEAAARRLIDRHRLNRLTAGEVVRVLATTHNLDADFFDHDFLPNVLDVSLADDRSYSARVALQRKLQGCITSTVVMAASAYQGRPSLRTTVHPLSMRAGVLHAKCTVVEYEHAVLASLGSANLTEAGFRRNREVAGVLTSREDEPGDASAIIDVINGAIESLGRLEQAWMPEFVENLEAVRAKLLAWHPAPQPTAMRVVWSDAETRLLDVLVGAWEDDPIERVRVVSPFWSEDGKGKSPLRTLLQELARAKHLAERVQVDLYFDARPLEGNGHVPAYPSGFVLNYEDLPGVSVSAHAIDPSVDPEELDVKVELTAARPLHAKVVLFEGGGHALGYAGSANFTRRGLGVVTGSNIEAGWLLRGTPRDLSALVPPTTGKSESVGSGAIAPELVGDDDDTTPYFPAFLREAQLEPHPDEPGQLCLLVAWASDAPKHFECFTLERVDARGQASAGIKLLSAGGPPAIERVTLSPDALEALLLDRELWVSNVDSGQAGAYPINVAPGEARLRLPLAPGSTRPGEEALLAYYQGKISFEDLYPPPDDAAARKRSPSSDPLERSGVDTSQIQSYRVRSFVEALPGLKAELMRVLGPKPIIEFAFLAEASPVGLARAIEQEVGAGGKSPTAAAFQLVEILKVIRVAAQHSDQRDPEVLAEVAGRAESIVQAILNGIQTATPQLFVRDSAFSQYQATVLGSRNP